MRILQRLVNWSTTNSTNIFSLENDFLILLKSYSVFKQTFVDGYFEVVELMKQSGLIQAQDENEKVKDWIESHKDVVGSTVKHSSFGTGKVTEIKDNTIVIDFEDKGRKSLAIEAVVESDLLDFE